VTAPRYGGASQTWESDKNPQLTEEQKKEVEAALSEL